MAHGNCESMRSRAFTKGRAAFDSDDEYRRALNGEFDGVREDFSYEANEDPDDGDPDDREDAEDLEYLKDLEDDEAVRAELGRFEEHLGGVRFLEVLEKFMKVCSKREGPPYLPFEPVQNVEHLAHFCNGSETLRLRYGAYGFEVDRMEGDEVVQTWKNLSEVDVLNDWDDALYELAEEAELEKEDLEDRLKDEFFDDTLPGILGDRKRGAAFLDFVMGAVDGRLGGRDFLLDGIESGRWLRWTGETFVLRELPARDVASWSEDEFLEGLRAVAWDDPDARECVLGGDVEDAWDMLDGAWYNEDEDGLVADSVGEFLADIENAKAEATKCPRVDYVTRDVAVCEEADTGRAEMKMVWGRTYPDTAELTLSHDGEEETLSEVPLAFLRWWRFCRNLGWQ